MKSDIKFHCHEKSNWDLNFKNLFLVDGEFTAIDYEWTFNFPIPLEYLFWEIIDSHLIFNPFVNEFTNIEEIYNHLNLDIGNLDLFRTWENNFLNYIIDHPPYLREKIIPLENIEKYDQVQKEIALKNKEITLKNKEIEKKNKVMKKKDRAIKKKNKEIKSLLNSNSWKITKPLRKLKSVFKK